MRLPTLPIHAPILAAVTTLAGCGDFKLTYPDHHVCLVDSCGFQYNFPAPVVQYSTLPVAVAGGLSFKAISLGRDRVCAVTTAGDIYCWGAIDLGTSSFHTANSPERVVSEFSFDTVSVGNGFACAIATDKRAMCWGVNDIGQVGNGTYGVHVDAPTPVYSRVAFTTIAAGGWDVGGANGHSAFACGLGTDAIIYCWGSDDLGQLGSGAAEPNVIHVAPYPVAGNRTYSALAGNGFATTCGLSTDRAALCWGSNAFGEFGTDGQPGTFPPTVVASDLRFVTLSTGYATCGIATTGDTYCWGSGGMVTGSGVHPARITSIPFVSISAGAAHACGLTSNGTAYCWGANESGQLGDGTLNRSAVPVLVNTELRFTRIVAGNDETCGLTTTGAAYCWGSDGFHSSMLGRGT